MRLQPQLTALRIHDKLEYINHRGLFASVPQQLSCLGTNWLAASKHERSSSKTSNVPSQRPNGPKLRSLSASVRLMSRPYLCLQLLFPASKIISVHQA